MRDIAKQCRYDVMDAQTVDGVTWPDCLSLNIDVFPNTKVRRDALITQLHYLRPDLFFYRQVGTNNMEDVILWLNNISSRRDMQIGSVLKLPSISEINTYFVENRKVN